MTIGLCRTISYRNSSALPLVSHSSKTDVEWIIISISSIIFALAFLGNTAALLVMFGKQGPVRLTNSKYLANLACADLLRACFMPFTIIARMKRNFMFGRMICKILPVVQGLSVAVDVFTLVCISIERYLAICHPLLILNLRSARFSTLLNALILIAIWMLGLLTALPNLHMYNLCSLPKLGRFKCEKTPLRMFDERVYMLSLDAFYFLIPMLVMIVLYTSIIWEIYRNSTAKKMRAFQTTIPRKTHAISFTFSFVPFNTCFQSRPTNFSPSGSKSKSKPRFLRLFSRHSGSQTRSVTSDESFRTALHSDSSLPNHQPPNYTHVTTGARAERLPQEKSPSKNPCQRLNSDCGSAKSSTSNSRLDRQRHKTLKLLIILIVEFCVCWMPLYIYHTLGTFDKNFYRSTSNVWVDVILLFSFASASCNPLTYYFMSKRYRSVLYAYLPCCSQQRTKQILTNRRNQHARQLIKVMRSSQENHPSDKNCIEPTRVNLHRNSRLRSIGV